MVEFRYILLPLYFCFELPLPLLFVVVLWWSTVLCLVLGSRYIFYFFKVISDSMCLTIERKVVSDSDSMCLQLSATLAPINT